MLLLDRLNCFSILHLTNGLTGLLLLTGVPVKEEIEFIKGCHTGTCVLCLLEDRSLDKEDNHFEVGQVFNLSFKLLKIKMSNKIADL